MKLYYPLTIDLYKIWPLPAMTAQQNNVGRGAVITLIANGAVIEPDGETVSFYVRRPDGYISYLPVRVDGARIYCDFTNQMLLKPGRLQVEIQLIGGTEASPTEITTPIFLVDVQPSNINESAIEGQNEFTALQQALAQTAGAVEGANGAAQKATAAASAAESASSAASSAATAASSAATAAETAGTAASQAATAASSAATAATNAAAAANAAAAQIPELKPIATSGAASDVSISSIAGMAATNVQAALAEQYSKIPIAQTADPAGQKAVINAADCRRYGNLCFCYVDAYKTSGTLVSEEALFKLPWKPILNTYFAAVGRNTASGASGLIQAAIVAQTGIVCTVGEASAYNEVRCQIAYWSA